MRQRLAQVMATLVIVLLALLWPAWEQGVYAQTPEPESTGLLEEIAPTRTPVPTATPGIIAREINRALANTALARTEVLGLSIPDWFSLGASLVLVLLGYLLGTWLIRRPLPRLVQRTSSQFDDRVLQRAGPDLRWLVVLLLMGFATQRLQFVSFAVKSFLVDAYFVLGLAVGLRLVWRLIDSADEWYREHFTEQGRLSQLDPVLTLLVRLGRVILVTLGITVLLSHFGINVSAFAAALGIGGLAISLAARDTIADAIAGFIILVDRPFRIGDRIEIEELGTWGDVIDIGLRTTRIRTRDNRMVIVPNSIIGSNQVINYTYPDPRYRIQTHVGVAYGTNIEAARQVMVQAVRQVAGVLQDKPVDALYIEMGSSAMIFRVRWWIESYIDTRRMFDRVHTALQEALDEAGIESPYPIQEVRFHTSSETDAPPSQLLRQPREG
jgi:MscS family membrane protein